MVEYMNKYNDLSRKDKGIVKIIKSVIDNNFYVLRIVWKVSKVRFLIKLFLTVMFAALPILNIIMVRYIIAKIERGISYSNDSIRTICTMVIGITLFQLASNIVVILNEAVIDPVIASKINQYINKVFFDKVQLFSYENFESPDFFNKYTQAIEQLDRIAHTTFNVAFQLLSSVMNIIMLSTLILSLDGIIMLFTIFAVSVNFIQSIILGNINFKTVKSITPFSRRQNYIKYILYNYKYVKDIKCYKVLDIGKRYYELSTFKILRILKEYGIKAAVINIFASIFNSVTSAWKMIYMFFKVVEKIYSIADYSALVSSSNQLEGVLSSIADGIVNMYKNSLEIDKLIFILSHNDDNDKEGQIEFDCDKPCEIEVKNLYFKYINTDRYVLKNISFKIFAGEKVSIVGLNGSGKTTLIKLLLRLYEPESGEILINNVNIKKYNKESLQKGIGIAFQENNIFAYTMKENIAFEGEVNINTLEILRKLDISPNSSRFINDIDTELSKEFDNNGTQLSKGEEQKICLARAMNRSTGLYILDEPSSSLDPISEYKMYNALKNLRKKTILFVSHRLAASALADRIILLENGEILEFGSHSVLITQKGRYAELFNKQSEYYTI